MSKPSKKQILKINRLRALFPKSIAVRMERSQDGGFFAEIKNFPGCVTEADTFSELIEMVNDAIRTYFEIPKNYLSFMPTYIPPLTVAQRLEAFPILEKKSEIIFERPYREKVHSQH